MSIDVPLSARVAEEILAMLARKRVNKAELARRLQVSHTWVTNRLAGHQDISLNEVDRIARVLGVAIGDLLPREVRPNERSAQVAEQLTPAAASAPASAERLTRCVPDVRSSSGEGTRRRPKVRQSAGRPIPASVVA